MSRPVRARRLTQDEGTYLLRLVRRGRADTVRYRRGLIIMASSSGTPVPAIARLVAAHPDTVRDVIHAFNAHGMATLEPHWGAGRPRRISEEDIDFIVATAKARPKRLGLPFTRWSIRKLAAYVSGQYGHRDPAQVPERVVRIGRERVRRILHEHEMSFQRTRTWKTSTDPAKDAKLDRIDEVMSRFPDRVFAFDQFGPLSIRPCHSTCWASKKHPDRLPATPLPRDSVLPWLLRPGPGPVVGRAARAQGRRPHPGRTQDDPGCPPGRCTHLRHRGQPGRQQDPGDPGLGRSAQGRAVPDPDERLLGRPRGGAVRATATVHDGQLRLPQPHRPGPRPARLPALAQRQQPPPRRAGRPTLRTRPRPQRTPQRWGRPRPQAVASPQAA